MEGLEANGNSLQPSDWTSANHDDMFSTPQSSESTSMQYTTLPRMIQTFTTVQLPEGAFQLTTGGGFQQIYMNSSAADFDQMSEVDLQSSSITSLDNIAQVQNDVDNRQQMSVSVQKLLINISMNLFEIV